MPDFASAGVNTGSKIGKARLIAACGVGNALEFYDFVVYSFFARTIGALFFPSVDPTVQLLLSFGTYGVGFFLRPLGGIVIGAFADRRGRKPAAILTLFLMALGTAAIGLVPTYGQIGILAPMIVVLARLVQGFSAGGEVGASTTLLAEYAPPEQRGFFGSWQLASQGLAVLVAAGFAMTINGVLSADQVKHWGWRIPFVLGILVMPVGLWLRSALSETHANEATEKTRGVSALSETLREHLGKIFAGVALIIGGTASNAVVVLYMSTYAVRQLHMTPVVGLLAGVVAGAVTLIASPVGGMLSDRFGRKPVALVSYLLIALAIYPAFLLLNATPTLGVLMATVLILSALNATGGATIITTVAEIFPAEVRATGMSLVYALGVAIFGGFGQFIVTWLIAWMRSPIAPAWYVIVCCAATVVGLRAIPEMAGQRLSL
ncbi:MAG: MFS transporter [Rhodospirillales bacterium]|nr:MFS transporter [Rhodospirillales bacterium]